MAIQEYLEQVCDNSVKPTGNGSNVATSCPFCNDHKSRLYVNVSTHLFFCHNCGERGNFIQFIEKVENISFFKAVMKYKEVKGSAYIPDDIVQELKNQIFQPDFSSYIKMRPIPLPQEYQPLDLQSKNPINNHALKYLYKRGITDEQITDHKMGYCVDGEHQNRLILPIYENKDLRFWVSRATGKSYLKEKSPSNEPYQISKSQVIFNIYNAATIFNSAVICEGIFDALAFGDMGISLLGKSLYDDQLAIILQYKDFFTDGVYLALDNDKDGRKATIQVADELSKHLPVKIVEIPERYNDPNNVLMKFGRKAVFSLLESASEYDFSYRVRHSLTVA